MALFGILALSVPNAFKGIEAPKGQFVIAGNLIYFSFVTLTTIGYGDIIPLHPYARGLANLEAVIGQLYPATLLARLVTLEISSGGKVDNHSNAACGIEGRSQVRCFRPKPMLTQPTPAKTRSIPRNNPRM